MDGESADVASSRNAHGDVAADPEGLRGGQGSAFRPPASTTVPYRPTRPSPRETLGEFLAMFSRAKQSLLTQEEPPDAGDGWRGAVLVIPTLFCGDWQTRGLRAALSREGYAAFGWELGADWGPTPALMDGVETRLLALSEVHGPVSLVGLSMGGLFCRWLAFRHPDRVRQVITVCSPFRTPLDSFWLPLRPALKVWPVPTLEAIAEELERPLPVPGTYIYSECDGIVSRESCIDPRYPRDCFAIQGPHVTIADDPSVTAIVLERLGRLEANARSM